METIFLLKKLQDIKHAIGEKDDEVLRQMVVDAEEFALRIQRSTPEQLRRQSRLEYTSSQA